MSSFSAVCLCHFSRSAHNHSRSARSCSARSCSGRSRSAYLMADGKTATQAAGSRGSCGVSKRRTAWWMVGRRTAPRVITDTGGYSAFASDRGKSATISAEPLRLLALVYDGVGNGVAPPQPFVAPSAAAAAAAAVPSSSFNPFSAASPEPVAGGYSAFASGGGRRNSTTTPSPRMDPAERPTDPGRRGKKRIKRPN